MLGLEASSKISDGRDDGDRALAVDGGVVEEGYLNASRTRKATFVRLPWVRKPTEETP